MADRITTWAKKAPDSVLDYALDLTAWAGGDTISGVTLVSKTPADITVGTPDLANKPVIVTWLSGGTHGTRYALEFKATTAGGRQDVFVVKIDVVDPAVIVAGAVGANQAA